MSTTVDLGKVSLSPMDEYTHGTQYEKLDLVTYQRGLFIAKEDNQNILPTVTSTWMKIGDFSEGAVMTDNVNGVGHPDGTTITVDANGTFSATCKVVYVTEVPTVSNATRNTLYIKGSSADGFSIYTLIGNTMENVSKMIPKYAGSSSAGGSATSAVKLQTARTIQTNLNSTSTASFDGTANVTPGVTGTLPVANGGTGQTTLNAGMNSFINSLDVGTAVPKGEAYFVSQDANGGTLNTYFRRPISKIWDYIKNQIGTKGSATQPVYMNAGVPTACSYSLNKTVPSDAKFTDTVYTHPTSSGNKHIPSGGSSGKLLRWNSDGTAEWSGATNGSATQPVYMNAGVPTACTYTLNKSVPSNAVFTDTNTWRPVQNNLTSTSTSDCLSANQGRILKGLIDGKPINTVESKCLTSTTSVSHNGAILTYTLTFTGTYIILIYLSNNSTGGAWFGTGSAISDPTNVAYGTVSPGGTLMKILTITKSTTVGIWNQTGSTKSYGCGTCFCCMRVS